MEYIRNSHSVYLLTYHIVFVTKYRRPVIDRPDIRVPEGPYLLFMQPL